jgi:phosphatidylserine/phosphatidylglycerophosphate/cardiolipin synthase-like enzyme
MPGTRVAGRAYALPARQIEFIADITAADAYGHPVVSQAIFDRVLAIVHAAREFVVLDYFLFNGEPSTATDSPAPLRRISQELRDALIERRRAVPALQVLLITDPINEIYGAAPSSDFAALRAAGVDIAVTDVARLRDSNFLYSSLWRLTVGWWGARGAGAGSFANPLASGPRHITLASALQLANFKANHRRTIIADDGHDDLVGIIGSADPHDVSSAYSNIAVKVRGPVLEPLLASELAIAAASGWRGSIGPAESPAPALRARLDDHTALVSIVTEGSTRDALLAHIDATVRGDFVDIAMSTISDRAFIESLLSANARGVGVRIILDPSTSGPGDTHSSLPNGPVASELMTASDGAVHLRWYRTHGEAFHSKLVMISSPERVWATLGSADLTRRALEDYDLTANVTIELAREAPLALQMSEYFETLWSNRALLGVEYSADFGVYADSTQSSYWVYRLMESTGLAGF